MHSGVSFTHGKDVRTNNRAADRWLRCAWSVKLVRILLVLVLLIPGLPARDGYAQPNVQVSESTPTPPLTPGPGLIDLFTPTAVFTDTPVTATATLADTPVVEKTTLTPAPLELTSTLAVTPEPTSTPSATPTTPPTSNGAVAAAPA